MEHKIQIVKLAKGPSKKFAFLIHPLGGEIYYYKKISAILGTEFTVYGIKSTHSGKTSSPDQDIKSIASHYLALIQPYIKDKNGCDITLSGWSMGGMIAFEMAQQLLASGKKINTVVLFDTYTPEKLPSYKKMDFTEFSYHIMNMLKSGIESTNPKNCPVYIKFLLTTLIKLNISLNYITPLVSFLGLKNFKKNLLDLKQNINDPTAPFDPLPEWIKFGISRSLVADKLSDEEILSHYQNIRQNIQSYEQYQIKFYDGHIVLLRGTKGYRGKGNQSDWKKYCTSIEEFEVPADHYQLITHPTSLNVIKEALPRL